MLCAKKQSVWQITWRFIKEKRHYNLSSFFTQKKQTVRKNNIHKQKITESISITQKKILYANIGVQYFFRQSHRYKHFLAVYLFPDSSLKFIALRICGRKMALQKFLHSPIKIKTVFLIVKAMPLVLLHHVFHIHSPRP